MESGPVLTGGERLKSRTALIIVLVVLIAVLLVIRFGIRGRGGEDPLFKDFKADRAACIAIASEDTAAVLRKVDGVWFVTTEDSLPAEAGAVGSLLDNIAAFSRKDMISSNPDKYDLYQVDSAGVWVALTDAGGDTLVRFVVGKPGPDYQSTYVRDMHSGDVILAPGYLRPMFDRGERSWQDRTIYAFKPDEIVEIEIQRPGEVLSLSKDGAGQWFLTSPESAACDQSVVTRLIRTLAYLKSDDFAGRMPAPSSGLAEPDSSVRVRTTDGIRRELLFGHHREDGRVFARRADSEIVYLLVEYKVEAMLPGLTELRAPEESVEVEQGQ
jgi:hypothetical protein